MTKDVSAAQMQELRPKPPSMPPTMCHAWRVIIDRHVLTELGPCECQVTDPDERQQLYEKHIERLKEKRAGTERASAACLRPGAAGPPPCGRIFS
jgi:hypothetical protein